jgi:hypothetical protein
MLTAACSARGDRPAADGRDGLPPGKRLSPIGRPLLTVIINSVHADQLIGWLVLNRDPG